MEKEIYVRKLKGKLARLSKRRNHLLEGSDSVSQLLFSHLHLHNVISHQQSSGKYITTNNNLLDHVLFYASYHFNISYTRCC